MGTTWETSVTSARASQHSSTWSMSAMSAMEQPALRSGRITRWWSPVSTSADSAMKCTPQNTMSVAWSLSAAKRASLNESPRASAHLLEASEDDLEYTGGSFSVRGTPGAGISIQEIALATFAAHNWPEGMEPSIDAEATFDPVNFSYPHGTHLCAMEVDTETGMVKIRKYACVDDVGVVVNPLIVEGQVHGGVAQGIAQALYEEAVYDADGNLTTGTFVDYLVPSAADLPHFETGNTVHPAPGNPIGAKGIGEAGCIASTPAVVNAALDAVRHLGVSDILMPLTPERVWRAISQGGDGGGRATAGTNAYGGAQTETTTGVSTPESSLGGDR